MVSVDYPLLEVVPEIYDSGYVLVKDGADRIVGIVTAADLSLEFAEMTRPFLLVGQIERIVRRAIDRCITVQEIQDAVDPDFDGDEIAGAHSLTLGQMQSLLQSPHWFERFGWPIDRKIFNDSFDAFRKIRNEVMHFSPDPVSSADTELLSEFLSFVNDLERRRKANAD